MDVVGLHPTTVRTEGHRRLMRSQFGSGLLLVGNVPGDRCGEVNATAMSYARGSWDSPVGSVAHVHAVLAPPVFSELEELEATPSQSCRACTRKSKECPECAFRDGTLSLQELSSVQEMQESMYLDKEQSKIRVSYPLREEAKDQQNNYKQVRAVQMNIERRVKAQGLKTAYDEEVKRMLEAGAARPLSNEEMRKWWGGVHYLPHFPVLNPESAPTSLRIVMDS